MSDFLWSLIIGIIFVILGAVFVRLGLIIWKKQRIDLVIRHHMDQVSDDNKRAYCKLLGIGILNLGIGFVVSGIWMLFAFDLHSWIPMAAGFVIGILLMTVSIIKYNR